MLVSPFLKFSPTTASGAPYRASQYALLPYTLAVVRAGRTRRAAGFVRGSDEETASGAGERIGSSSEASDSDAATRASAAALSSSSFRTASFARSASSLALEERCSAADAADNVIAKVEEGGRTSPRDRAFERGMEKSRRFR